MGSADGGSRRELLYYVEEVFKIGLAGFIHWHGGKTEIGWLYLEETPRILNADQQVGLVALVLLHAWQWSLPQS